MPLCRFLSAPHIASCAIILMLSAAASAAEPQSNPTAYPRTLSATEMQRHFEENPKFDAQATGVGNYKSFTMTLKSNGWYVGFIQSAGATFAGTWKIAGSEVSPQLCLKSTSNLNGTIDIGGCYVLQQTGEKSFVLANKASVIAYGEPVGWGPLGGRFNSAPAIAAVEIIASPILIDITSRKITPELFKRAAAKALSARGWNITNSTADQIDGSLTKGKEYRVSILYRQAAIIKIAFVPGHGKEDQSWLRNLQRDMESEFALAK